MDTYSRFDDSMISAIQGWLTLALLLLFCGCIPPLRSFFCGRFVLLLCISGWYGGPLSGPRDTECTAPDALHETLRMETSTKLKQEMSVHMRQ